MKVMIEEWAIKPDRAHATDAGLDLMAPSDGIIDPGQSALIDTGVHVQLPAGTCGILISKSGLNVKSGVVSTGLIDEGYTGSIMVKLYNHGNHRYIFHRGDKVTQLVVVPCMYEPVELVEQIAGGDRGSRGFGSTGR